MVKGQYTNQILATCSVCLLASSSGIAISWVSPALLYLHSDESHLGQPLTIIQIAVIGSCFAYGAIFFGIILTSILLHFFGRKIILNLLGCPLVLFWILVRVGTRVEYLYVARICSGWTAIAVFFTSPVFIIEYASPKIRQNLACCVSLFVHCGGFIGMLVNSHLDYDYQAYVFIWLPAIFMILFAFFPDTPQQLLRKRKYTKARDSLRFYRNYKVDSTELEEEFNAMKTRIEEGGHAEKTRMKDLTTKKFRKSLFFSSCLICFNVTTGSFTMFNYIGLVYRELHAPTILGSVIYVAAHVLGAMCAGLFSNRFLKTRLMTFASIVGWVGMSIVAGLSVIAENEILKTHYWIFILLISSIFFTMQFGVHSITHIAINELYDLKTKEYGLAITYFIGTIATFGGLKAFPLLLLHYGVFPALLMFAIIGFLSTLFYALLLPETGHVVI